MNAVIKKTKELMKRISLVFENENLIRVKREYCSVEGYYYHFEGESKKLAIIKGESHDGNNHIAFLKILDCYGGFEIATQIIPVSIYDDEIEQDKAIKKAIQTYKELTRRF